MEKTLIIIKPDAVANRRIGSIISRIEKEGFQIAAMRYLKMEREQAARFYEMHRERPFYSDLVNFMTSGPVVAAVLAATNAIQKWRDLIGATDPQEAAENTIRKLYAENRERNAVHGSDSRESAEREISFFFDPKSLLE